MGGISFTNYQYGTDIKDAWNKAYQEATERYGNDSYNGSLNTCSLGRCTLKFDKWSEENEEKAYDFIEDKEHHGERWVARVVDLGVSHCEIVKVKKVASTPTAKYKLKYVVKKDGNIAMRFNAKKDADAYAVNEASRYPHNCYSVSKEQCVESGSTLCTSLKVERKTINNPTKADLKKKGCIVYHKYIFYGFASC